MADTDVMGYCPMGCGKTLSLAAGGHISCMFLQCPRPDAVTDLLAKTEHERVKAYVSEWGDGLIEWEAGAPLYARDLCAVAKAVLGD